MSRITAQAARDIPAPAEKAYGMIADYVDGHPRILPPAFSGLVVERGGYGAGTEIRFTARLLGQTSILHAVIEEPEPGRVLVERYPATGTFTTFTIDSAGGGQTCRVTIHTELSVGGIGGLFQRLFVPPLLRKVFREELINLERCCSGE
jgi:hypothetical protein